MLNEFDEYMVYVNNAIEEAEVDIKSGRVYAPNKLKKCLRNITTKSIISCRFIIF